MATHSEEMSGFSTDPSSTDTVRPDPDTDAAGRNSWNNSPCIVMNLSGFRVHDDSEDLISNEASNVAINIVRFTLIPALFLFGFPSNLVNMAVFFKHGLKQRINLCLFCLSVLDLVFITFAFLMYAEMFGGKMANSYRNLGRVAEVIIGTGLTVFYASSFFSSQYVSAVIAGERFLCVVWPLRFNSILSTKAVSVILCVGILPIFGLRFLLALRHRVACVVDVATKSTTVFVLDSELYWNHQKLIEILESSVFGFFLPVTLCGFITITTVITAVSLHKSTEFQKESSSSSAAAAASSRNLAVTRMIICLSVQFIICNLPNLLFKTAVMFLPELSTARKWSNSYILFTAIGECCGVLSSSVNCLVYFFFGSKYRESVLGMLCCCQRVKFRKEV